MSAVSKTDVPTRVSVVVVVGTALRAILSELRHLNRFALDTVAPGSTRQEQAAAIIAELNRRHRHPNRCC